MYLNCQNVFVYTRAVQFAPDSLHFQSFKTFTQQRMEKVNNARHGNAHVIENIHHSSVIVAENAHSECSSVLRT